jgi:hypothetical protein
MEEQKTCYTLSDRETIDTILIVKRLKGDFASVSNRCDTNEEQGDMSSILIKIPKRKFEFAFPFPKEIAEAIYNSSPGTQHYINSIVPEQEKRYN